MEVQCAARREAFGAFNLLRRVTYLGARIKSGLRCKAGGSDKQRCRGQSQEVAELASSDLRFFITFIRKVSLIRRSCVAYISFV